jgi:EmrB/QacA subfamily drug resistance transporter
MQAGFMMANLIQTPVKPRENIDPAVLKIAVILLVGGLAPLFDTTMVNVAINTLTASLHTTMADIQWVITGYLLAMSMTIPVSGWAVNRFGGKRMWLFSLGVFLCGSVLSALSWDVLSLIVSRIFQGIGAGLLIPILMTLTAQAAGGKNLGQIMSLMSLPALFAPIFGPVLGGIIVHTLGWHWIFFINIPICIVAFVLAWHELPENKSSECDKTLDITGILLLSPALALLVYAISRVSSCGESFGLMVITPLIVGIVLLGVFIIHAISVKKGSLLDIGLFKSRTFSASCVLLFAIGAISAGAMLLLPLYFQQVRGADVLFAGLWLIPEGLGMLLTRSWIGKLTERIDSRVLVQASLVVVIIGIVPFSFAGPDTSPLLIAATLFVEGIGLGGVLIPVMASAYRGLDREQIPHASSATRIFQLIGGAFGSAAIAVIIQHRLQAQVTSGIAEVTTAYAGAFWWLAGLAIIAILSAFALPLKEEDGLDPTGTLQPVH